MNQGKGYVTSGPHPVRSGRGGEVCETQCLVRQEGRVQCVTVAEMLQRDKTSLAQLCLDQCGYIVLSWSDGPKPPPRIGEVLQGPISGVVGPFVVIGEATEADAVKQARRYSMPGSIRFNVMNARRAARYFKVVAE